ncbi:MULTISPECIES: TRADD-N-associated membrane domain-containing protein, partial [Bacteria]|uniref:TRADD-N-associated membrane domain-containing protein n=1 Tax=Bacteria TaxID=2 RepID=UPI003F2D3C55
YTLNSNSFDELNFYVKEFPIINQKFINQKYDSKENLIFNIQNEIGIDKYSTFNSLISQKINYVYPKNYELQEFYIPTNEEIRELLFIKNKKYENLDTLDYEVKKIINNNQLSLITKSLIKYRTDFGEKIDKSAPFVFKFTLISFFSFFLLISIKNNREENVIKEKLEEKQNEIKLAEKENPLKIGPIWELGRLELGENITQARKKADLIFYFSIAFIIIGFIGLCWSIFLLFSSQINISILIAVGSIILEFFGGTFIFLYKTTISQLNKNIEILDKINNVGMSLRILDSLDPSSEVFKAKIEISKLLINSK